ncbi:MAG: TIGR04282 family arsenosugar biosynthesis glycosyltransferase [Blastocatellia bacterium]
MAYLSYFFLTWIVLEFIAYLMLKRTQKQTTSVRKKLILFTRYPEPGRTKTRLIPALGAEGAANLQKQMTEYTVRLARQLFVWCKVCVEIRYEGGELTAMQDWLGTELDFRPQGSGDLGARMQWAFDAAFAEDFDHVVLIGTDCPDLTVEILATAFAALKRHELVLGPAQDGGYYLIGWKRPLAPLLQGIAWGTDTVLAATLTTAAEIGVVPFLLPMLNDVDRPEDIAHVHFDHHPCPE